MASSIDCSGTGRLLLPLSYRRCFSMGSPPKKVEIVQDSAEIVLEFAEYSRYNITITQNRRDVNASGIAEEVFL